MPDLSPLLNLSRHDENVRRLRLVDPIRTLRIFVTAELRLQPGLYRAEQPEPHLVVIACE